MKRRTLLASGAGAATLAALGLPVRAQDPVKVGFIYIGPVGDGGWTYQHDQGRQEMQAHFGDAVESIYQESVPESADAIGAITQMVMSGAKLIFTTSFGYMDPTLKVAKKYPKVTFEHATGFKRSANMSTYSGRFYEGRYIQGIIAGMMSKAGVVGYIGSIPIPEVIMGMNAFILGMRSINPNAKIKQVFINSWYDPGKEADAAKALLDQGADIVAQHTDSPAPLQVAAERGLKGFGQASDMIKFAPNAQLTSSIDQWDNYYIDRTKAAMDGTWTTGDTWGGLKSGMLKMANYANMPDNVRKAAIETEQGIRDAKIVIFKGPINAQDGSAKVAAGQTLNDGDIAGMNWLAEGVEGDLPK